MIVLFTADDPGATDTDQAWSLVFGRPVQVSPAAGNRIGLALSVSPNPAMHGRLALRFTLPTDAPSSIDVIDTGGRLVRRERLRLSPGNHVYQIGGTLVPGVYMVRLTQGDRIMPDRAAVVD